MTCVRFLVSGRVQGVFFRASTCAEALRLHLTGYARNMADGRVEVLACGDDDALADFERWLHEGPPLARVTGVQRHAGDESAPSGFRVV